MSMAVLQKPALKLVPASEQALTRLLDEDQVAKEVLSSLTTFVNDLNDDYLNIEPWFVFNAWLDYHPTHEAAYYSVFRAWQMFHWTPDTKCLLQPVIGGETKTLAAAYLKLNQQTLSPTQTYILTEGQKQQLDFYEVTGLNDQFLTLYGLISRKKISVYHPELSSKARIGEYLLASVLPIDQMRHIFLGTSQLISRQAETLVYEFCKFVDRCEGTERKFNNFESDAFNLFYDLTKKFSL